MIRFPTETNSHDARPGSFPVCAGQIDLWEISLVEEPAPLERLDSWLSDEERTRAAGFLLAGQTRRYTVCHGATRQILGQYLNLAPETVVIDVRPDGKPFLTGRSNGHDLRFNLTHSGDLALLAVALGVEVGVDVEQLRSISGFDRMVQRCLERTEREQLLTCPPADRIRQFLRFWTHKEAYLKTFGVGLRRRLQDVVVDLQAPAYWRVVSHRELFPGESAISLVEVPLGDGFVGALAWASEAPHHLSYFTWSGDEGEGKGENLPDRGATTAVRMRKRGHR